MGSQLRYHSGTHLSDVSVSIAFCSVKSCKEVPFSWDLELRKSISWTKKLNQRPVHPGALDEYQEFGHKVEY